MFGSYFGKKEIVELMVDHSVAKKSYSEKRRKVIKRYGYLIFRLFGFLLLYPISMLDKFLKGTGEDIIVKVQKSSHWEG